MLSVIQLVIVALAVNQTVGPLVAPLRETPIQRLHRRTEHFIGSAPATCGQFLIQEFGRPPASISELRAAIACVQEHRSRAAPAWVVVQLQGIDSWVAYGLLAARDGQMHAFSYDSDPSGGSGVEPRLSMTACPSVRVGEDAAGWAEIRCHEP